MKKFVVCFFAVIIVCAMGACGLDANKAGDNLSTYTAVLNYDHTNHTITGQMSVDYVNKTNTPLKEIKFNLFPNAFRDGSQQSVISLAKSEACYYNGKSFGKIYINNTGANSFEICGSDQNILKINLPTPLPPTLATTVEMEFEIVIPNISHRFGYGENTVNLGNFLPTLCVHENGEWQEIEYHSNGDPFFSEAANYNVTLSYPENLTVASTGVCTNTEMTAEIATKTFCAKAVRDFAMVLSEKLQVISANVDGIKINYFYHNDLNYALSLETASKAVKTFNNLFGKYPYEQLSVVQANFCIGGMEFPNLVLIGDEIDNFDSYQMVIVHEIAHQWWYGVVGNNQTSYAWMDESLAEFSTALFYEKNSGYNATYDQIIENANTNMQVFCTVQKSVLGQPSTAMNRTLKEFASENEYIYTTYVQGLLMFDAFSKLLSEKVVIKCLKNYYTTYAFQVATPAKMIASFEKTTSCNLEPFFNSWILGKVVFAN